MNQPDAILNSGPILGSAERPRRSSARPPPRLTTAAQDKRNELRSQLLAAPIKGIEQEEIDAHFAGMPARYWEGVTESELTWGLATIHRFFQKLAEPDTPATSPVLAWRHFPARGFTKVMLCTWDRYGLLAKAAAAFSAARVNIIQADVYTRVDHVVLDVFRVCETEGQPITDASRFHQMLFLLEGALTNPPRFASLWACCRHKFFVHPDASQPTVTFDNYIPEYTTMRVEATDRLGLLYDILQALADCGLNIDQAVIDTDDGVARDTFHLTDLNHRPITHPPQLELIRTKVREAIVS
jgi:[protein-PII] uridylyltransferase